MYSEEKEVYSPMTQRERSLSFSFNHYQSTAFSAAAPQFTGPLKGRPKPFLSISEKRCDSGMMLNAEEVIFVITTGYSVALCCAGFVWRWTGFREED